MNLLGHVEEAVVAANDAPMRHDAEIVEDRHDGPQQFRHAAAIGRGVHMQHPRAPQPRGGIGQRLHEPFGGELAVRSGRSRTDIDELEHVLVGRNRARQPGAIRQCSIGTRRTRPKSPTVGRTTRAKSSYFTLTASLCEPASNTISLLDASARSTNTS